jgi:hypothetical protein
MVTPADAANGPQPQLFSLLNQTSLTVPPNNSCQHVYRPSYYVGLHTYVTESEG